MTELNNLINNSDQYLVDKLNILLNIYNNYISFNMSYNVFELSLASFRNSQIMLDDNISNENKATILRIINNMLV